MKNIPEIRLKGFKEEWKRTSLEEVSKDYSYGLCAQAIPFDGLNKYIRITDIDDETREYCPKPLTTPSFFNKNYEVKENDILFVRTGASVGKTYLYKKTDGILYYAGFLIKMNISEADSKFIFMQTLRQQYYDWIISESQRSGQPGINLEQLKTYKFLSPSFIEQQTIGTFFQNLDNLITEQKNKLENLQKVKKSMLCKMFPKEGQKVPEIRFKGFEGDWEEKRLREICILNKGKQINKQTLSDKGKYYVLNGGMTPSGYTNKYNASGNTISISEGGNSCGYVFYNKRRFWSGGHNYTINQILLNKAYLFEYLKSNENEIMQLRIGSGLPNIQKNSLLEFKIMYPAKLSEQNFIGNFFMNLDEQISLYQQKLEKLKNLKQSLLSKMFV